MQIFVVPIPSTWYFVGMKDKMFRFTTNVEGVREPMVDWYSGESQEAAKIDWDEDCHRYGLPMDKVTVAIVECNPETLIPL